MAEVVPEPLKTRFCELLRKTVESAVREAERVGAIERIEEFTSLIYWASRLEQTYRCPSTSSSNSVRLIKELVRELYSGK